MTKKMPDQNVAELPAAWRPKQPTLVQAQAAVMPVPVPQVHAAQQVPQVPQVQQGVQFHQTQPQQHQPPQPQPQHAQPYFQTQPHQHVIAPSPIAAPGIDPWPTNETFHPSLLLLAVSGGGKTEGVGSMLDEGFRVLHVAVEPKLAVLNRRGRRPDLVHIARPSEERVLPSYVLAKQQRWDRLWRFVDELRAGKYVQCDAAGRWPGQTYHALSFDGLSEAGELAAAKYVVTGKDWSEYVIAGNKLLELFDALRDAAGTAATQSGVPPIITIATCREAWGVLAEGAPPEWLPELPGKMAGKGLAARFEAVWRLETGYDELGNFEYRVWTQKGSNFYAKSPGNLFRVCERGGGDPPYGGVLGDGWPSVGRMFRKLLSDEHSVFWRDTDLPAAVERAAGAAPYTLVEHTQVHNGRVYAWRGGAWVDVGAATTATATASPTTTT